MVTYIKHFSMCIIVINKNYYSHENLWCLAIQISAHPPMMYTTTTTVVWRLVFCGTWGAWHATSSARLEKPPQILTLLRSCGSVRAGGLRPLMVPPLWMMLPLLVARSRWLGGSGRTLCPVDCWGWCLPSSRGKDCVHPRPAISCDGPLDAQYWWELLPLLPISMPTWRLYGTHDSPFILHLEGSESAGPII